MFGQIQNICKLCRVSLSRIFRNLVKKYCQNALCQRRVKSQSSQNGIEANRILSLKMQEPNHNVEIIGVKLQIQLQIGV